MKTLRQTVALVAALFCLDHAALGQKPTPLITQTADQWIAVLKSDSASHKDKVDACRQLAVVGTKDAVPALAALLPDEKMNHMARYALETIPDASAATALRDALTTLQGRPLIGVITSVGVLKDTQSVESLTRLLQDQSPEIAQAAARALGDIASGPAADALKRAVASVDSRNQLAFCEGLMRCAEKMNAKGESQAAVAIYDQLRGLQTLPHVRVGALRGAILARRDAGLSLLQESLINPDYVLFSAAVRTSYEIPGAQVTKGLAAALPKQPDEDRKVLVLQALGKRTDQEALPPLSEAAKAGSKTVRVAAIQALAETGNPAAAQVLSELVSGSDRQISQAALESLAGLQGKQVDAIVTSMLTGQNTSRRLAAIELIGRRRMVACLPDLIKASTESHAEIRPAALSKVGELGSTTEIPVVLDLLPKLSTQDDFDAAEQALSSLCGNSERPEACAEKITAQLSRVEPGHKGVLLRVLSGLGGPVALKAVRAAVNDSNPEVHAAAIRALGSWKTADAAPDLLELAKNAGNPTDQTLSLRSYLSLAANQDVPAAERLAMCRDATAVVKTPDDKRLLLSALGSITLPESIGLITPYLDNSETKEEAAAAITSIAERMLRGQQASLAAPQLVQPLEKVVQSTSNETLSKRAKSLLEQARKRAQKQ